VRDLFYVVASNLLALVCFASALAKTIQQPDPFRSPQNWVLAISNARWFALVEFGMGALLALPVPMAIQAAAALALTIVIVDGQFWHARHPEQESEGFGSVTPSGQLLYVSIGACVVAGTLIIVLAAARTPAAVVPGNRWITAILLLALLAITCKLGYDQSRGQGYARRSRPVAPLTELPANLFIGSDALGMLTTSDLAASGRAALIVGLSAHSPECRDVHALLISHAKALDSELNVIVIAQNDAIYRGTQNTFMRRLVDPASHVSRWLGLHVRPYAMLVNHDLTLLAAPSLTSPKVQRLITLLLTQVQNAPATYLTLDGANQPQH